MCMTVFACVSCMDAHAKNTVFGSGPKGEEKRGGG